MNLKRIGGGHGSTKGVKKASKASKMNLLRGQLLTYERPENGVHASIDDLIQNITTTPNYITTVLVSMEPNEVKKVHDQLSKMKSFHTEYLYDCNLFGVLDDTLYSYNVITCREWYFTFEFSLWQSLAFF